MVFQAKPRRSLHDFIKHLLLFSSGAFWIRCTSVYPKGFSQTLLVSGTLESLPTGCSTNHKDHHQIVSVLDPPFGLQSCRSGESNADSPPHLQTVCSQIVGDSIFVCEYVSLSCTCRARRETSARTALTSTYAEACFGGKRR